LTEKYKHSTSIWIYQSHHHQWTSQ